MVTKHMARSRDEGPHTFMQSLTRSGVLAESVVWRTELVQ